MTHGTVVVHNTGGKFRIEGVRLESKKLSPSEIATLLRAQR